MNWVRLHETAQLEEIDAASREGPVLIFKHSTRCNISAAALSRLERAWTAADDADKTTYFLDLLAHRNLSHTIAERYGVEHGSPQTLVIRDGRCVHVASHFGITYEDTVTAMVG